MKLVACVPRWRSLHTAFVCVVLSDASRALFWKMNKSQTRIRLMNDLNVLNCECVRVCVCVWCGAATNAIQFSWRQQISPRSHRDVSFIYLTDIVNQRIVFRTCFSHSITANDRFRWGNSIRNLRQKKKERKKKQMDWCMCDTTSARILFDLFVFTFWCAATSMLDGVKRSKPLRWNMKINIRLIDTNRHADTIHYQK